MKIYRTICLFVSILGFLLFLSCSGKNVQSIRDFVLAKSDSIVRVLILPVIPTDTILVTSFGAVGDSVTDCKEAFDKAITVCENAGGGVIKVPKGTFTINGPLHLKSCMNLYLQKGAKIRFGSDPQDYLPVVLTSWEGTILYNYSPFIYARNQKNVAITGQGVIDGEASDTWNNWKPLQSADQLRSREYNHKETPFEERIFGEGHFLRPHLIQFFECENILIDSIRIEDSPFWCIHLPKSNNITIRNISYDAQNKNNDGIDPEYSQNVLIENVSFDNRDDNIAIKAGRDHEGRSTAQATRNVVIRNCHFKGANALAIGSEMSAGVNNIFVYDCDFRGSVNNGIVLKSNKDRGGTIHNIYFNNIRFGEVRNCFSINSNYKNEGEGNLTSIYDIFLNDIQCKKANNTGISIIGFEGLKVSNVQLRNLIIDTAAIPIRIENAEMLLFENVRVNGLLLPE